MCGIGVIAGETTEVLELLFPLVDYNDRRGPDGFGIALINPKTGEITSHPFVIKGFDERDIARDKANFFRGIEADAYRIGATIAATQSKYSTRTTEQRVDPESLRRNMQPNLLEYPDLGQRCIGICNGEIRDGPLKQLITVHATSDADVDTRTLTEMFHDRRISFKDDWRAARWLMENVQGAFTFGYSDGHGFMVMKDRLGIRPGCIGRKDSTLIILSESGFFEEAYGEYEREMKNGEAIRIDEHLQREERQLIQCNTRPCGFEDIYFKDWFSRDFTGESSVGSLRFRLGQETGWFYRRQHNGIDAIAGAPDSGKSYAAGAAYGLHLALVETARKPKRERYFLRRKGHKYSIDRMAVQGKSIAVYEDSLVRGDTVPQLYYHLKRNGAEKVKFFVVWPPILFSCDLGIDTADTERLIARQLLGRSIRIGEEGVQYVTSELNRDMTMLLRERMRQDERYANINPDDLEVYYAPQVFLQKVLPYKTCTLCFTGVRPSE